MVDGPTQNNIFEDISGGFFLSYLFVLDILYLTGLLLVYCHFQFCVYNDVCLCVCRWRVPLWVCEFLCFCCYCSLALFYSCSAVCLFVCFPVSFLTRGRKNDVKLEGWGIREGRPRRRWESETVIRIYYTKKVSIKREIKI